MSVEPDLEALLELVEQCPLCHPAGWKVVAHVSFVDATEQRSRGIEYGIFLIDPESERCLGFDNHYGYDGAAVEAPWDHEHRPDELGRHYRYDFTDFWALVADFFERVTVHCAGLSLSDFRGGATEHD